MVLCFVTPLSLSLDAECGPGPTATAPGNRSPNDAVNTKGFSIQCVFLLPLLRSSDWQSHSLPREGEVVKIAKTGGRLFIFIGRGWP